MSFRGLEIQFDVKADQFFDVSTKVDCLRALFARISKRSVALIQRHCIFVFTCFALHNCFNLPPPQGLNHVSREGCQNLKFQVDLMSGF